MLFFEKKREPKSKRMVESKRIKKLSGTVGRGKGGVLKRGAEEGQNSKVLIASKMGRRCLNAKSA